MDTRIRAIRQAMGYVTFKNNDIKDATIKLLNEMGSNLEELDYSPPQFVDDAVKELQLAISDFDNTKDTIDNVIEDSKGNPIEE